MWTSFFLSCIVLYICLLIPGFLVVRVCRIQSFEAILLAPIVSVFLIEAVAAIYTFVGVRCSCTTVIPIVFLISCGLFFLFRKSSKIPISPFFQITKRQALLLLLYVTCGVVIGCWIFLRAIKTPEAFAQVWDNATHINMTKSFLETGAFPFIGPSSKVVNGSMVLGNGFYPTVFHTLAALLSCMMSVPVTVSINALNFVFAFVVFPLGCLLLFSKLFRQDFTALVAGGIICLGFVAFPWRFLYWGTIFPNLIAFCMVPLAMWVFIDLLSWEDRSGIVRGDIALFVLSICVLVLSQTNAVFTLGVLLLPFILSRTYKAIVGKGNCKPVYGLIVSILVLITALILWIYLWSSPFLSGVIQQKWPSFDSRSQAIIDIVSMALPGTGDHDSPAQIVLAVLFGIGFVFLLLRRKLLWVLVSFSFVAAIYCINLSTDGFLKSLLSGFWYEDQTRIAAMLAIAAMPISVYGLNVLLKKLQKRKSNDLRKSTISSLMLVVAVLAIIYYPSYTLKGISSVETAYGAVDRALRQEYVLDGPNILDSEEIAFLKDARSILPDNAIVLNQALDGSVFAYGVAGINTVYTGFYEFTGVLGSDAPTELIKRNLNDIGYREDVRDAVAATGADYFIQLDAGAGNDKTVMYASSNFPEGMTQGMDAVSPDTPGFDLIMERDDMKLYKITAIS